MFAPWVRKKMLSSQRVSNGQLTVVIVSLDVDGCRSPRVSSTTFWKLSVTYSSIVRQRATVIMAALLYSVRCYEPKWTPFLQNFFDREQSLYVFDSIFDENWGYIFTLWHSTVLFSIGLRTRLTDFIFIDIFLSRKIRITLFCEWKNFFPRLTFALLALQCHKWPLLLLKYFEFGLDVFKLI